jgi:hypothetical protein
LPSRPHLGTVRGTVIRLARTCAVATGWQLRDHLGSLGLGRPEGPGERGGREHHGRGGGEQARLLETGVVVIVIGVIFISVVVFGHLGRRRRDRIPGREVGLIEDLVRRHLSLRSLPIPARVPIFPGRALSLASGEGPRSSGATSHALPLVAHQRRPGRRGGHGGGSAGRGGPGGPGDCGCPGRGHGRDTAAATTTAAATGARAAVEAAPVEPKALRILTSNTAGPAKATRRRRSRGSRGNARPRGQELLARDPAGVIVQRGPKPVTQAEDSPQGSGRSAHRRARRSQQR